MLIISSKGFIDTVPKHPVCHSVPTALGPPAFAKARRLDAEKLESAKKESAAMEAAGVIRHFNSRWASPLHMVQKPDGFWRPCSKLNTQTVPNRYPFTNIADFTSRLKGYFRVPMSKKDIPKTAVMTPFGLFGWLRLPVAHFRG